FRDSFLRNQDDFGGLELQPKKSRRVIEKLGDISELEGAEGRKVNEHVSADLFAAQHRDDYRLSSGLDAVEIRGVICKRHRHARSGLDVDTSLVKRRFPDHSRHVFASEIHAPNEEHAL